MPDSISKTPRSLTPQERALIRALSPEHDSLDDAQVVDMDDGGMGSLRFVPTEQRRRATAIAEAQFTDDDGVLVSIELNVDTERALFELDFWKVDFSRLRRYPRPDELKRLKE